MKTIQYRGVIGMLMLMTLLACLPGCKKDENKTEEVTLKILSTTEVTESSFVVSWSTNATNIRKITIDVAMDDAFVQMVDEINVENSSVTSWKIEDLFGASYYYVRLIMEMNDGSSVESDAKTVKTSFQDEGVNLTTSDGLNITGRIKYLNSNTGKRPAIVFMHQFMCLGNSWNGSETERKCVANGWVCLVINFRGHFSSDDWPLPTTVPEMYDFVGACSYDMLAAVEYLRNNSMVDPDRIALIGASLGANETLEGNCLDGVVTSVALSPSLVLDYEQCAGIPLKSVYYIVGEFNNNSWPDYPADTQVLYGNTQEPKKLSLLPVNSHGWDLLDDSIEDQIVDWLDARFSE